MLHSFVAPTMFPGRDLLRLWQCAQTRETCSSTRIRREKNERVEPLRPEECHQKPEAGRCLGRIWRSDDGHGLSKYRRWREWLRENTGESISGLTDTSSRTHRTPERSSGRAPVTACQIQTPTRRVSLPNMAGGGRHGLVPTVRSSQGAGKGIQRGGERAKGAPDGTTLHVGVCSVRQLLGDGESWSDRAGRDRGGVAAPVSRAAHLGIGRGSVSRDVEHSRDPSEGGPVRTLVRYRMRTPDPALPGDAQNYQQAGTHSPQFFSIEREPNRKARHHRRTTSERPGLLFLHTVLRLTLHLCMRFFSFVAGPLAGDPCPSFLRLTSPHSPWPSVCFINVEGGRFCFLDRMSWTVRLVKRGAGQGSHWVWEGTPSPVQNDDAVNIHPCRARHVRLGRRVIDEPHVDFTERGRDECPSSEG